MWLSKVSANPLRRNSLLLATCQVSSPFLQSLSASMSYHRWELFPLGSIPHEVLSILLGSLPKVPDQKQEEEALERQYSTHDDRLSDDEDEEARRSSPLIQDDNSNRNGVVDRGEASSLRNIRKPNEDEDEGSHRPWNVPDEEWEWSDEESSSGTSNSRALRPTALAPTEIARHGASLNIPSRTSRSAPPGLGLTDPSKEQHDTKVISGSTSSNTSASASPNPTLKPKTTIAIQPEISSLSVAQDLYISICDSGHYMACASKKMFAILRRQKTAISLLRAPALNQGKGSTQSSYEWVLIGQGSGVDTPLLQVWDDKNF
ncbi:hypothetical protein BGX21_002246 [Mortierella sp. AD011]|nr:hypothetical protein BGX20_008499 [Mortierella sp. AD010]KAF9380868.1 hypothetical protein BGX21_002246 [Mortierella sp. AD011]